MSHGRLVPGIFWTLSAGFIEPGREREHDASTLEVLSSRKAKAI
jgi:hypothetical protein